MDRFFPKGQKININSFLFFHLSFLSKGTHFQYTLSYLAKGIVPSRHIPAIGIVPMGMGYYG